MSNRTVDAKELALRLVAKHAERASREAEQLNRMIRAAHSEGASLRQIADVAGVSHQQVKRIVDQVSPED